MRTNNIVLPFNVYYVQIIEYVMATATTIKIIKIIFNIKMLSLAVGYKVK